MLKMIYETISEMLKTTTQEKILQLIKENKKVTQTQIAKILGITRDGVAYNIRLLKEKNIIKRVGSTKNGSWKIIQNDKINI